jgi:hypothetical protein
MVETPLGDWVTHDDHDRVVAEARELLLEVGAYDKAQRLHEGYNLSGLLKRIDAWLEKTK